MNSHAMLKTDYQMDKETLYREALLSIVHGIPSITPTNVSIFEEISNNRESKEIADNAKVFLSKYYIESGNLKKGEKLLKSVLSTKNGWQCACSLLLDPKMVILKNNKTNIALMIQTFFHKFSPQKK